MYGLVTGGLDKVVRVYSIPITDKTEFSRSAETDQTLIGGEKKNHLFTI